MLRREEVKIHEVNGFIHDMLLEKYRVPLQNLNTSFYGFLKLLRKVLHYLNLLRELVKDDQCGLTLVENCIALVAVYFKYDLKVDYNFCDNFFTGISDFLDKFVLYFHQVIHIESTEPLIEKEIKNLFQKTEDVLQKITGLISDLKKNFEKNEQILLHISEVLQTFMNHFNSIMRDITFAQNSSNTESYMKAFNDFFKAVSVKKDSSKRSQYVEDLLLLIRNTTRHQILIENNLSFVRKIAVYIKSRDKKRSKIEMSGVSHHIIHKYCLLLGKPDFISTCLAEINMEEFIEVITSLMKYKSSIDELRNMNPIFFSEPNFKLEELITMIKNWRDNLTEIANLRSKPEHADELAALKEHLHAHSFEFTNFGEALKEYQSSIAKYHILMNNFNKFRMQVQKYCLQNFKVALKIDMTVYN